MLSGTPGATDVGTNLFLVGVTNQANLASNATMAILVTAPVSSAITLQISAQGAQILLNWTGGAAPFQVQMASDLTSAAWADVGLSQTNSDLLLPLPFSNSASYFRVYGQ